MCATAEAAKLKMDDRKTCNLPWALTPIINRKTSQWYLYACGLLFHFSASYSSSKKMKSYRSSSTWRFPFG
ncbi:hypothetical protein LEMLEM_LOCUS16573 [Lemmus lemmus]